MPKEETILMLILIPCVFFLVNHFFIQSNVKAKQAIKPIKEPKSKIETTKWFSEKRYHEMNRNEKRAYKRWLAKNEFWDGDIVIENQERMNKL